MKLWRNVGRAPAGRSRPLGNWLALRLRQPGGNRDAIGAWGEGQGGGRTRGPAGTRVGGGGAGGGAVRGRGPGGEGAPPVRVSANQFVSLERGANQAVPWHPPRK